MTTIRKVLLICCMVTSFTAQAQHDRGTITVPVRSDKESLAGATAELLSGTDSALLKAAITDQAGNAVFEQVPAGIYLIRLSMPNFQTSYTNRVNVSGSQPLLQLPAVVLPPEPRQLGEVVVIAKKPFIEKLRDRIVVNVGNSIVSAGSSAMDLLERAPGVNIDQNDVLSLKGKQGVIIMIDGKPAPMSGSDIANYLRSLPSATIERIDIITTPPAKYDAAGNSGIIDIRMKKDQRLGINGNFTAGYGQGIYPKANSGSSFNYRNKILNAFGNYNYSYRVGLNHLLLDRSFYENGVYNGGDLKDNYSKSPLAANAARVGLDFFPSAKSIIGFVLNGNFNHYTRRNDNSSVVIDPLQQTNSTFRSYATNNDHADNQLLNINFRHKFDSSGKELTADADYGSYRSSSLTGNATRYFKPDGSQLKPEYILNGDQSGTLTFKTAKVDFVQPLKKGARWEAGLKTSFVSSDNNAKFFDVSSGSPENDTNKTNHFIYRENNNAAYLNVSREYKKFNLQVGLRGEQTHIETAQQISDQRFDSSYFQLFPSAFFNYKLSAEKTLGISVSRRIGRPGYADLNPFLFLIDVTTYATGRPGLLPQITWSYEISYTLKTLSFTGSYSHTTNNQNIAIAKFRDVFPNIPSAENVTVQIPINLASSNYFGLSVSAPVRINKWWNMITNADLYYEKFHGNLGASILRRGKPVADIRINNNFTFSNGWTAELNGNFNSGAPYGFMVLDPQWGISAGLQKAVLQNKGTVKVSVTDIFWTDLPSAIITYDNYIEKWHAYRESRVANFTFAYRFGSSKLPAARKRTTASEEERQRAN